MRGTVQSETHKDRARLPTQARPVELSDNPEQWTLEQWEKYYTWVATQNPPPMWGPFAGPNEFYRSEKWQTIVRRTLEGFTILLKSARRIHGREAMIFYTKQCQACRQELQSDPPGQEPTSSRAEADQLELFK